MRTSRIPVWLLVVLSVIWPRPVGAQAVVVNHTSLALFGQIPDGFLQSAQATSLIFVNRSVGWNISNGLTCLENASNDVAPYVCTKTAHEVSAFSSPASEVQWNRPGGYPRTNWRYFGWPGTGITPELPISGCSAGAWYQQFDCFIRYVDANPFAAQVFSWQFSYLEVQSTSDILSPTKGFFVRGQADRADVGDLEALIVRHPQIRFVLQTTSLARGVGTEVSTNFNAQLRAYAQANRLPLLDVADIESYDPWGRPCLDDRDGVPYVRQNGTQENYPNDGRALPAICQHYTPEIDGGHIGNPASGYIRTAKAWWILMARLTGWNPDGPPADLTLTTTTLPGGTVGQSYAALLGASGGLTPYAWSVTSGTLPAGLALDAGSGRIAGTPTTQGTSSFTAQVSDGQVPADAAARPLQITVAPASYAPLAITTTSLPTARRNKYYTRTLAATGGLAPITWSVVAGSLPPGLTLNASTGQISGRPTTSATYNFTVQVRDSQAVRASDTQALAIIVTR